MAKAKKVLGTSKFKLSDLKRNVYQLAGVISTKELKALNSEFASLDFRRKENWQFALTRLEGGQSFEEWRSNPQEKYRAIFKEIDDASKEYKDHVASSKKVFECLEESVDELDKLTNEVKEDAKALQEETLVSIPISFSDEDITN